ncbi:FMN-dependent NADH-azoreductase [Nitrincola tapanii]|uniref:FMN dependent NADH:quinone oxidoreductase n=1 Tax=Nitrincola tapanii TaxID=1708751 RepID=A0A5A9W5G1_9GAMM|nr:NAD(P)H-dependent oxidoreductase [Nitrincola tapanii]KAA0875684.1 FMN-dependent NADH-azoreductase [Nitrincola tapanii]
MSKKSLLVVQSSILADNGQSNVLAQALIQRWQETHVDSEVKVRDLGAEPVAHFDAATLAALMSAEEERTPEQAAVLAQSSQLIAELQRADHLVIAAPMYNFAVPSQLKAWIDRVVANGITFKYTDQGPVGLLQNKPVTLLATRGGMYKDAGQDFQIPWLKQVLAFIGLTQVEVVYAEGLNMAQQREASLAAAQAQIAALDL